MKINKAKGYIVGITIGLMLGITALTYGGSFDSFTGMTQSWFDAIKTKLNGTYSSGKVCTSDAGGQIQCITDMPVGGLGGDGFGSVSYKVIGTNLNDTTYSCLDVIVPEQCLSEYSSEAAPPCEIIHSQFRLGLNTLQMRGTPRLWQGYSKYFRIIPRGPDVTHYTGKSRIMGGFTSNGSNWFTHTTTYSQTYNREFGRSNVGGILGRDKYASCSADGGVNSNSNPNKNPRQIKIVSRNDYNTVVTIRYPLSKGNEQYTSRFTCGITQVGAGGYTYNTKIGLDGKCRAIGSMKHGALLANSSNPSNINLIEKWCYDNTEANCNTYGGLYTWYEAMGLDSSQTTATGEISSKSVCGQLGNGWHLPSNIQFTALTTSGATGWLGNKLGGLVDSLPSMRNTDGTLGTPGPAGYWWSSTWNNITTSYLRRLNSRDSTVYLNTYASLYGFSVLCVKD